MKIELDPERFIPNICEKDAENQVVIIKLLKEDREYLGMLIKHDNTYYWNGSYRRIDGSFTDIVRWESFLFNVENSSLIKTLINSYKHYSELGFNVTFHVIKDITELMDLLRGDTNENN